MLPIKRQCGSHEQGGSCRLPHNYAWAFGWEAALAWNSLLRSSPIAITRPDENQTLAAARWKLRHPRKLSLADAYLIALAESVNATIVTTDSAVASIMPKRTLLLKVDGNDETSPSK